MKFIQKLSYIIFACLMMGFSQCSSSKKMNELQEQAPFTIGKVAVEHWAAGIKEGGRGFTVYIPIQDIDTAQYLPNTFYFDGKKLPVVVLSQKGNSMYIARYKKDLEEAVVMHNDMNKEAGNKPPKLQEKIPFQLAKDEGVLEYLAEGKAQYVKITGIITKTPVNYPSAPTQKQR